MEQRCHRLQALQQSESRADAGGRWHEPAGRAFRANSCGIHLPTGTPRAGRPNGIFCVRTSRAPAHCIHAGTYRPFSDRIFGPSRRSPDQQSRHPTSPHSGGGTPLSGRVPVRPARHRPIANPVATDPAWHHPARPPEEKAHGLYQKVWTDQGSPLLVHSQAQQAALKAELQSRGYDVPIALGMRYGKPSIAQALEELGDVTHLIVPAPVSAIL